LPAGRESCRHPALRQSKIDDRISPLAFRQRNTADCCFALMSLQGVPHEGAAQSGWLAPASFGKSVEFVRLRYWPAMSWALGSYALIGLNTALNFECSATGFRYRVRIWSMGWLMAHLWRLPWARERLDEDKTNAEATSGVAELARSLAVALAIFEAVNLLQPAAPNRSSPCLLGWR
jgi:hypothetical protein